MQIDVFYSIYKKYPSIQTDSRKIQPNDLFFALKGDNFNGNKFAQECLDKGAAYCILDEEPPFKSDKIILVENVLLYLQQLALFHRQQFNIPFIAITGSNGKTTTKELVAAVLSTTYNTYFTKGNLNNHIGIPLTILSIPLNATMAIIEMGANHLLEIESYCKYTLPTFGIITNCGKAHLEGFGSIEGVQKGKSELFKFLALNHYPIFVNEAETYLSSLTYHNKNVILFNGKNSSINGTVKKNDPFLQIEVQIKETIFSIHTNLIGAYNLSNILAAVCIGNYFNVSFENIKKGIELYIPNNQRSQCIELKNYTIYLDAYNANPSSMIKAIENFSQLKGANKCLFLGAMKELGEFSFIEHQQLINLLDKYAWRFVALVGVEFALCKHNYHYFNNVGDLKVFVAQNLPPVFSTILIKGSRSTQMEKMVDVFKQK
ncbi:MAG: UDP-N-acetylmuramoyl-tripeptide--D-alanyl-D-alanine ligase [Sediminibacterium sp.]|nr:UDP-N-acetylmuramoyl-tripeptide--D-alanyl-D-alanine ligase [Sediminibacterium sp.]